MILLPTFEFGNAHVTVPVTENDSLFARPVYSGVPVTLTVAVPSQFLFAAVKPVMVRPFAETALPEDEVEMFTVVAEVLVNATAVALLYEVVTEASGASDSDSNQVLGVLGAVGLAFLGGIGVGILMLGQRRRKSSR